MSLGLPLKAKARHVFVAGDVAQIVVDWVDGGPTASTCTSRARQATSCAIVVGDAASVPGALAVRGAASSGSGRNRVENAGGRPALASRSGVTRHPKGLARPKIANSGRDASGSVPPVSEA